MSQGLLWIVELGSEAEALAELGRPRLDREALMALGERHNVATLFVGELVDALLRRVTEDFRVTYVRQ